MKQKLLWNDYWIYKVQYKLSVLYNHRRPHKPSSKEWEHNFRECEQNMKKKWKNNKAEGMVYKWV